MEDQVKEEPKTFSFSDVGYREDSIQVIKQNILLNANLTSIFIDFEETFKDRFSFQFPWPKQQVENLKTDLFCAFANGVVVATNTHSEFRKRFNLPKQIIEDIGIIAPKKSLIY